MGAALGLSPEAYIEFERGRRNLTPARLRAFAQVTNSDVLGLALSWAQQSPRLGLLSADNKAVSIAVSVLEDLAVELGAAFDTLSVSDLIDAFEAARRQLRNAALERNIAAVCAVPPPCGPLTARQLECLHWVQSGKSSRDIAVVLNISPRTVENHIRVACQRLNVRTRVQAVSWAIHLGLLAPRPY